MGPEVAILTQVLTAASAAGAGVSAISALQQGRFQQKVANANAQQAQLDAESDAERASRDQRREFAADVAKRSAFGSLGGSDFAVLADAAITSEEKLALIKHGGDQTASSERLRGIAAKAFSKQKAFGSLLSGAASAGNTFVTLNDQ